VPPGAAGSSPAGFKDLGGSLGEVLTPNPLIRSKGLCAAHDCVLLTLHMILVTRFLSPECYVLAMRDISDVALLLLLALLLSAMGLAGMFIRP
jgi:hypothetical protein